MVEPFRWELFDDEGEYEETPLRDRKERFPDVRRQDKRAELIRDVIAMANSARLFGKPAYLLYGLRNDISDPGGILVGINDSLSVYRADRPQSLQQVRERVLNQLQQLFMEYIEPPLASFDIRMAERDDVQAAYLVIEPVPTTSPFCVRKDLGRGNDGPLHRGDCWIRIGESKHKVTREQIAPEDARYAYSYAQVPYVLPRHWHWYLHSLMQNPSLVAADGIQAYQPLMTTTGVVFESLVDQFLAGSDRLLVIKGQAGSGKTAALNRAVAELARFCSEEVEGALANEEFRPPSRWIPFLAELKGFDEADMAGQVLSAVNRWGGFWETRPQRPEQLLERAELHWLLCLDGLDEILSDQKQRAVLSSLKRFMDRCPSVRIVLTTRPDAALPDFQTWKDAREVEIAGFSEEQISHYISNFVETSREFEEYVRFLKNNADLWTLCAYPLYLAAIMGELAAIEPKGIEAGSAANTQTEDAGVAALPNAVDENDTETEHSLPIAIADSLLTPLEELLSTPQDSQLEEPVKDQEVILPISLGRLLDRIYCKLWDREKARQLMRHEAEDWWVTTARLAADTDGHRIRFRRDEARQVFNDDRALARLLSLGILDTPQDRRGLLCFRTDLTKAYFAAVRLAMFLESEEGNDAAWAFRRMTDWFRDPVRRILVDLTVSDLSVITGRGEPNEPYSS